MHFNLIYGCSVQLLKYFAKLFPLFAKIPINHNTSHRLAQRHLTEWSTLNFHLLLICSLAEIFFYFCVTEKSSWWVSCSKQNWGVNPGNFHIVPAPWKLAMSTLNIFKCHLWESWCYNNDMQLSAKFTMGFKQIFNNRYLLWQ